MDDELLIRVTMGRSSDGGDGNRGRPPVREMPVAENQSDEHGRGDGEQTPVGMSKRVHVAKHDNDPCA